MMRIKLALTLMVAAATIAAATAAPAAAVPVDRAALDGYARCVLSAHHQRVYAVLAANGSVDGATAPDCGNAAIWTSVAKGTQSPGLLLRGALAEAAMRHDFSGIGKPRGVFATLHPVAIEPDMAANSAYAPADVERLVVVWCATRNYPGAAEAVLQTSVGSAAELSAVRGFAAALGSCVVRGTSLDLSVPVIRALVAEAAFHISMLSRDPTGGPPSRY